MPADSSRSLAISRRRLLRAAGAGAGTALAGCGATGRGARTPTITPAPVPTDETAGTPRSTATPLPPPLDAIELAVDVLNGFGEDGPARLSIAFRNTGDRRLTVMDGPAYSVPFVDDDYVGTDVSGGPVLLLVPDAARLRIDPEEGEPGSIEAFLPGSPVDGCWKVPFDWPESKGTSTPVLHTFSVPPGDVRRHGYGLYFLEACYTGTFVFENTVDVAVGEDPVERTTHRVRLGFDVSVTGSGGVLVNADQPAFVKRWPRARVSPER